MFFNRPQIAVRLPLTFDAAPLKRDLETAMKWQFAKHPLKYHDGSWGVINLVYGGGNVGYTHEGDHGYGIGRPQETEVLAACPAFKNLIDTFPGEKKMVRLSGLPAHGHIKRHYDPIESVDFGVMRVHVPIVTDTHKIVFYLGYERQHWGEGEVWYGDFTFPHSVRNNSEKLRVHMILDLEWDGQVAALMPEEYLSDDERSRRARYRELHKTISWYHTRVESLLRRKEIAQ